MSPFGLDFATSLDLKILNISITADKNESIQRRFFAKSPDDQHNSSGYLHQFTSGKLNENKTPDIEPVKELPVEKINGIPIQSMGSQKTK